MSKKLILGLALASVLVSGPFIGAKADDISASCWAGFCPAQPSDMDRRRKEIMTNRMQPARVHIGTVRRLRSRWVTERSKCGHGGVGMPRRE